ncbi:hypothetical protein AHMF7616_04123 [Adhaeribacter pallidiroseus]|uniref:Uncharacterized protein n=1 Tax=Adhaeribacter pallidiroseus TaxID=2072847 RepID=A0A369QKP8_9BACT|nr:hypothetical protein AHMF7616_04123 [Adhaeribacter pallidiroseus]
MERKAAYTMKILSALVVLCGLFTRQLQAQPKIIEKTMAVPADKKVDL